MKKINILLIPWLTMLIFAGSAVAHVQLDYPVGGETFIAGDTVNIEWHIEIMHNLENWDLYFSNDGGITWEVIQLDIQASQLNYLWIVPQVATTQARIRIYMDNSGQDYEDISGDFTIQTSPTSLYDERGYPQTIELYANYPNPFNPVTLIRYKLSNVADIQLIVYNQLGKQVRTLVDARQTSGIHQVQWDGRDNKGESVTSGVYFYRLNAGVFTLTRKMVLLR